MAAWKIIRCLFIILVISVVTGEVLRKPLLREDDDYYDTHDPGEPPPGSRPNLNSLQTLPIKRYKCHSCDPPDCPYLTVCQNAVQCWKSRVRESSGVESFTRGCTTDQEQLPLYCRTPAVTVQHKRQASGQFQIDCCVGDFCNDGEFPELPPLYNEDMSVYSDSLMYGLKIFAAVLGPLVVFGTIGVIALYFLRRYYRNRTHIRENWPCRSDFDSTSINNKSQVYNQNKLLHIKDVG